MGTRPVVPAIPTIRDTYLTERELANQLPKGSVRKLRAWRALRIGPKWLRVGREVVYLKSSVESWLLANEIAVERERHPRRPKLFEDHPLLGCRAEPAKFRDEFAQRPIDAALLIPADARGDVGLDGLLC